MISAEAAMAEGFQPLSRKHQSEGKPSTVPLRRAVQKTRSFSDSFYATKTYRLGSLASLKFEELPRAVPFNASFAFAAPKAANEENDADADDAAAGSKKRSRRRVVIELQARRTRTTVSVDSGLVLALTVIAFACLVGQAAAYATMPAAPRAFRPASAGVGVAPAAPLLDPATASAASKLKRATRYLGSSRAVDEAVSFAVEAHSGQKRKSGEAYVVHPIETACILAEMKVDVDTVVAGLLHDVVEDTEWSTEQLCSRFGDAVASIVDGVTDVEMEMAMTKEEKDAFNQQRLLLAMGGNLNVVLVKLADRVHNMRTLGAMPAHKRAKKAKETMEIFVPLAKTIGVAPIEAELRALSAQHLSPLAELTGAAERGAAKEGAWGVGKLMGFADEAFASAKCPALLSEFLLADEALREADLSSKLASHRETWAAHCDAAEAPHLAGRAAKSAPGAGRRPQQPGWLNTVRFPGGGGKEAASHLRAAYATALVAGFTNTPAAFGSDSLEAVQSLTALFAQ
mmetsp:Transcript_19937/g.41931  ORF Transcript_19937/g.41931 Transcript_19937/m.41931 type:complete len:514 (-) Transcript_19937:161-1702(-)